MSRPDDPEKDDLEHDELADLVQDVVHGILRDEVALTPDHDRDQP